MVRVKTDVDMVDEHIEGMGFRLVPYSTLLDFAEGLAVVDPEKDRVHLRDLIEEAQEILKND